MLRPFAIALVLFSLSGCATALTAVSAIPAVLYEKVAEQFSSKERSFPADMRRVLAAVQQGLQATELDIDVLEIQTGGSYGIGFGSEQIDGTITLRARTKKLTTMHVAVRGSTRERSVEDALIETIHDKLSQLPEGASIDTSKYNELKKKPSSSADRVGWFRPGARLPVTPSNTKEWLEIELPSGEIAYLKASIVSSRNSERYALFNWSR